MVTKKDIRKFDELLQKHIEKQYSVKLCREFRVGESNVYGYILSMSSQFLLIQPHYDFVIDGYAVVPKDRLDSLRHNKFDKTAAKILKSEGEDAKYGIGYDIDLSGWQELFNSIKSNDLHVIIECEDMKDPLFKIGPIKKVNKSSVSIQNYDPAGQLDTKPTKISYADITIIKFDDHYSKVFRKYLKEPKSDKRK